mgnify:CR=1 FL=1
MFAAAVEALIAARILAGPGKVTIATDDDPVLSGRINTTPAPCSPSFARPQAPAHPDGLTMPDMSHDVSYPLSFAMHDSSRNVFETKYSDVTSCFPLSKPSA